MISHSLFVFILVQSSIANLEDSYPETSENINIYSDEFLDPDDSDIEKKDNHFMRFGRNLGDSRNKEFLYDDYNDLDVPIKRSGSEHIRYGRSNGSYFMRLGRDSNKLRRNRAHFMRIGRAFQNHGEPIRYKRSVSSRQEENSEKPGNENPKWRRDIFLRFGKSPSFLRYGRKYESIESLPPIFNTNQQLGVLLARLLASREGGRNPYDNVA
ncbi:FMRFamide-related peptides [Diorhabda sublineata]|uniref:FMRFamide-related peptides n=1 Tax=Diorhabda sublineata TaxID=1163346 RepID=UPI0024E0B842|nr:FMRFamide-related peptides [Diorhabda sublineata]